MKLKTILFMLAIVLLVQCSTNESRQKPPLAQIKPVEDVYFGTKISDSYRYMENLKDTLVQQWIKEEADYARYVLNRIPERKMLIEKMKEFDGRKSSDAGFISVTDNDRQFYVKTTPDNETGKLYYREDYESNEILLYDPETYSKATTEKYLITSFYPSIDGLKIAFSLALNGSECGEILTMEVNTRKLYQERINNFPGWYPVSWLPDNNGFLYLPLLTDDVHQPTRMINCKTYLHRLGTDPSSDKEIFSRAKYPELGIKPEEFPVVVYEKDCKYIFGYLASVDNRMNLFYAPYSELTKDKINWKHLFKTDDEVQNFYATDKDLYIYTSKGAPNFKILKTSLLNPDLTRAEVVVPEDSSKTIIYFCITCDGLYYNLSENGIKEKLCFLPKDEKAKKEIELPFPVGKLYLGSKGYNYSTARIEMCGWTHDYQLYRYSHQTNEFILENISSKPEYPEYNDLIVEELMIPSHDGVKVPLSLIYKKGIRRDGNNPVLLKGYGAYGISMDPYFSPDLLLWTLKGGILAIPHVRGGGELGTQWHKSGMKTTKPNTWKDLIACSEYLVREQYTSPQKIAINGGSAGGVLIGRAITERPDLFAATIPEVGLMNSLRLYEMPGGTDNIPEFGLISDSVECMALIEMDSYLHIKDGVKYPATLITAGMNDPRVIVWQPAKFAARLQAANSSDKPILFLTDYEAGHGISDTKTKSFERVADMLSFAFWQTGHPDYQPK
jgi:prolyl oligopeptidase